MVLDVIKQILIGFGVLFVFFVIIYIYAEFIEPKIKRLIDKRNIRYFIKKFEPSKKLRKKINFRSFEYTLGLSDFQGDKYVVICVDKLNGYSLKYPPHYLVYYNKRMLKNKENLQKEIESTLDYLVDNMEVTDWKKASYKLN